MSPLNALTTRGRPSCAVRQLGMRTRGAGCGTCTPGRGRLTEAASVAATAGGLSAAAEAAAQQETVTQLNPLGGVTQAVTGDLGKYAVAKGASRAAGEIEKIVARRLEQIVPAIYVANGKKLTVCLIEGVTLEGLTVREVTHGGSNPYEGLDSDR